MAFASTHNRLLVIPSMMANQHVADLRSILHTININYHDQREDMALPEYDNHETLPLQVSDQFLINL